MNSSIRQARIIRTSMLGIIVNVIIAVVKIVIGLAAGSLAIVSEGVNNMTDAGSSFLTLIGTKLSARHPDEKHPFGYGRVEYLTGLVVGILILIAGVGMLRESVEGIFRPGDMSVTVLAIAVVAFSAVVKFILGLYTIHVGRQTDSEALTGVGTECRNDAFMSVITVIVSVVFLMTGLSLDAWAGALFSLVVLKAAWDTLSATVSDLIGRPGDEELAKALYREIRSADGIISAADMMLHNYGPDRYSGSVNVEIDHEKTVGEVYEDLHALQLRLMREHNVTMVFGLYAVDNDSPLSKELRRTVAAFVREEEHVTSFHAIYISPDSNRLYCDLVVDYKLGDWDALSARFSAYMKERYPQYELELTIETDFV